MSKEYPEFEFNDWQIHIKDNKNEIYIIKPTREFRRYEDTWTLGRSYPDNCVFNTGDRLIVVEGLSFIENVADENSVVIYRFSCGNMIQDKKEALKYIL